jgi:hypothetical protein
MRKIKILANVTPEQYSALRKLSAETDVPVTAILRRAIDQYLAAQGQSASFVPITK